MVGGAYSTVQDEQFCYEAKLPINAVTVLEFLRLWPVSMNCLHYIASRLSPFISHRLGGANPGGGPCPGGKPAGGKPPGGNPGGGPRNSLEDVPNNDIG